MEYLLAQLHLSFCQLNSAIAGKLGILYVAASFAAILHDHRILENTLLLRHNPFSIKRYGLPAGINILFLGIFFVFPVIGSRVCDGAAKTPDWSNPTVLPSSK